MTGMPSAAASAGASMETPRSWASSIMFSASTIGLSQARSWLVSISARRRLRASATWMMRSVSGPVTTSRVIRSSSLMVPSSVFTPGVSITSHTSAPTSARPLVTATVVPG